MGSVDVVDEVNALLKLGVGDPYRLEHIKQAYILNSTIWKSDNRYLEQLREKYLVKHHVKQRDVQPETDENLESGSENENMIHCWKCGKKSLFEANFCMTCGSSLFEVGAEPQTADVKISSIRSKNQTKTIRLKIPVMIGIPVLILIILGVGFGQGSFDNVLEIQVNEDTTKKEVDSKDSNDKEVLPTESDSKCDEGTIFDEDTDSCVLEKESSSTESHSKCGEGTIFDEDTNSCVLEK